MTYTTQELIAQIAALDTTIKKLDAVHATAHTNAKRQITALRKRYERTLALMQAELRKQLDASVA